MSRTDAGNTGCVGCKRLHNASEGDCGACCNGSEQGGIKTKECDTTAAPHVLSRQLSVVWQRRCTCVCMCVRVLS